MPCLPPPSPQCGLEQGPGAGVNGLGSMETGMSHSLALLSCLLCSPSLTIPSAHARLKGDKGLPQAVWTGRRATLVSA